MIGVFGLRKSLTAAAFAVAAGVGVLASVGGFAASIGGGEAQAQAKRPPAVAKTTPRSFVRVQEVTSPQGIKAWLVSDSTVPMITLSASWRGGSAMEPAGKSGVKTIMADMLTEGSGDLDAEAFKVRLEELNMSLSFGANWDGVGFNVTTLSRNRDAAFDLARLTLEKPRFDEAPLARIKRQLEIGIRQRETNPGFIANKALDDALIAGHPYATRISVDSVRAVGKADLEKAYRDTVARDGMIVTVVGDIDAATLAPLLDKVFGVLPESGIKAKLPAAQIGPAKGVIVRALPQPQSLILFAAPGIDDKDPDWMSLQVANYIVGGGGFSSRLMSEVREKRGLVYGVGTGPSNRDLANFLRGSAQTENKDVPEALAVIKAELQKLVEKGVTEAEVTDAKRYLTGAFPLSLDSNSSIASVLHGYQWTGRDIDYINRRNGLIDAVTRADVDRVLRRLYRPEAFTFVIVGQPVGMAPTPG
jgi:zinc protease